MATTHKQQWFQGFPKQLGHCSDSRDRCKVSAVNVHWSVSSEHEPRCDGAVHTPEVVLQEGVLGRGGVKEVLCAHQDKVDAAVVEPIPTAGEQRERLSKYVYRPFGRLQWNSS